MQKTDLARKKRKIINKSCKDRQREKEKEKQRDRQKD